MSKSRKVWVGFSFRFCYQVLGTTALLKSFSSFLCERVIIITLLKINSTFGLCFALRNQACSEVWERESKLNLMIKGEKSRLPASSLPIAGGLRLRTTGRQGLKDMRKKTKVRRKGINETPLSHLYMNI